MRKRSWAISFVLLVLAGLFLWVLVVHEPVHEGWCTLHERSVGDPSKSQVVGLAWQFLEPLPSDPNEGLDLPDDFKNPVYYRMKVAADFVPVVVDLSGPPRLCVDTNRDGILTDERCFGVKSGKMGNRKRDRFGPIRIGTTGLNDKSASAFHANLYTRDRASVLSLHPATYRRGKLRIGRRIYSVAIVDGDYDGRFGSVISLPLDNKWHWAQADVFAIDYDRDGEFEISLNQRSEVAPLGRMVNIDGEYYAIDVTPKGDKLTLEAIEPELGRLTLDPPNTMMDLHLWSDAADQYLVATADGSELPVGTYQTLFGVLRLRNAEDDEWALTVDTNANLGPLKLFSIRQKETTQIQVGPPFLVTVDVRPLGTDGVSLRPVIRGCAGEEYQAVVLRNGRSGSRPNFRIIAEDGSVLVEDNFEYG